MTTLTAYGRRKRAAERIARIMIEAGHRASVSRVCHPLENGRGSLADLALARAEQFIRERGLEDDYDAWLEADTWFEADSSTRARAHRA